MSLQTTSSTLKGAIQLGIGYTVGNLSSKPERDVLMQDFYVVESIFFPRWAWLAPSGSEGAAGEERPPSPLIMAPETEAPHVKATVRHRSEKRWPFAFISRENTPR